MHWLKSSFSEDGGNNCVEIAVYEGDGVAIRESESPAAIISTQRTALGALVRSVKAGEIELPRP